MRFYLTPEQAEMEKEIYAYLEKNVTPELITEILDEPEGASADQAPVLNKFIRKLGADGWLGIGWPKEYGGQNRSAIDQYIFFDACNGYYNIPIPMITLNTVGPTIMAMGTSEQKERILPGILKGEMEICVGYTEPGAGSDLASLKTTAVKDGDEYVINGQKIFSTHAEFADYIWLAARTDLKAPKHKGISIFLVKKDSSGIQIHPTFAIGGLKSNIVFYDNVRVSKDSLVGEENQGWKYMNRQLAMERVALVPHSRTRRTLEDLTEWARNNSIDGRRVIENPWVRNGIAKFTVETEVLKLFNYRVAWQLTQGTIPFAESCMTKVYGSELAQRVNEFALQVFGLYGQLEPFGSELAPGSGSYERNYLMNKVLTFGGGANEVLRDAVAGIGLGLAKSR